MAEGKKGLLARIFGPKESGCCGVEFVKPETDARPKEAENATAAPKERGACCGSTKAGRLDSNS
jgi:hypothetical protein